MGLDKLSSLFPFFEEEGFHPKKSLSQNFLVDKNIIRKIIAEAEIQKDELILEIGPGLGVLTSALLEEGAKVFAIEKDRFLAKKLPELYPSKNLEVLEADCLKCPLEELLLERIPSGKKIKVVANLPYQILTPVIIKLLSLYPLFSKLVLMVQYEVAERIIAKPSTKEYGAFSVFVQFYTKPKIAFTVPPECFHPRPKVRSAIIDLQVQEPLLKERELFHNLVRKAFNQRRKKLTTSLKSLYKKETVTEALQQCSLSIDARPENLSVSEWVEFFKALSKKSFYSES